MDGTYAALDIDPRILSRLNCPLEEIEKLCRKFSVIELAVFGSVVRDDFRNDDSDIDFLYLMDPEARIGGWKFMEFHLALEELTHRKVDLVSKKWMGKRFETAVLPQARVIYAA